MIVVIADDITGAAEMGGIALRYGLRVLITDDVVHDAATDVLVMYTNTRSLPEQEAAKVMQLLSSKINLSTTNFFYKKTDSVLRGHVLAEIKTQMEVLGYSRALLVPVNPALGRIINDGKYFINGTPINQTAFRNDPEFPATSSAVTDMLRAAPAEVIVLSASDDLPVNGIIVGEASSTADVDTWAGYKENKMLFAGGAAFFDALLQRIYGPHKSQGAEHSIAFPALLVSGTTYGSNLQKISALGDIATFMPPEVFYSDTGLQNWTAEVLSTLKKYSCAVVAIGTHHLPAGNPSLLSRKLAQLVQHVLDSVQVKELLIEGGSTAYNILHHLRLNSFVPVQELQQGVVRMLVLGQKEMFITIKPGSYDWPTGWKFDKTMTAV